MIGQKFKNTFFLNGGFNGVDLPHGTKPKITFNKSKQTMKDWWPRPDAAFCLSLKICEEKGNNKLTCQNQNSPDVYDMFEVNLIIPKKIRLSLVQWDDCINIWVVEMGVKRPVWPMYIYLHHFECVGMGKLNDSATTQLGITCITHVGPKQHNNRCCIVLLGAR